MRSTIEIPPYRLDCEERKLWRGGRSVPLRPKSFAVLEHLVRSAGRLVSKDELLSAIWLGTHVADAALKVCVREIRRALDEDAGAPQFVETIGRRGYRFIGEVAANRESSWRDGEPFVGRAEELKRLERAFARALEGQRQVVFVVGQAGIGKTELLHRFRRAHAHRAAWAWGQCIEQSGGEEAYAPLLEAIRRLCSDGPPQLLGLLRQHARSWLLHLPALIDERERQALGLELAGSGHQRMLRDLVAGIEAIAAQSPLAIVLEDLHWSDPSTLELIAALARRTEPARLLMLCTYRPQEAAAPSAASVAAELRLRSYAEEILLSGLQPADIEQYLRERFDDLAQAADLATALWHHTRGNPLYVVNTLDRLVADGALVRHRTQWRLAPGERGVEELVPDTLAATLKVQIDALEPADARVLAAASLVGVRFDTRTVAAALKVGPERVRTVCDGAAAHGRLLRSAGEEEWPDGTGVLQYEFSHAVYRDAFDRLVEKAQRALLHRRVADVLERGYGDETDRVAAPLALHLELGGAHARAAEYRRAAARCCIGRCAYPEALAHFERGLELLERLPPSADRDRLELSLRSTAGVALINTKGFASPSVRDTFDRSLALCRKLRRAPELFQVLDGLHSYAVTSGDLRTGEDLARRMMRLAEASGDPSYTLEAHHVLGCVCWQRGGLGVGRRHLEKAVDLYTPELGAAGIRYCGHDPKVCCLGSLGVVLWYSGYPDRALAAGEEARRWARDLGHPYSSALAEQMLCWIRSLRVEHAPALEHAEASCAIAARHDLQAIELQSTMFRGLALAGLGERDEGVQMTIGAFERHQQLAPPSADLSTLLATACLLAGRRDAAARALELAQADLDRNRHRLIQLDVYVLEAVVRAWSGDLDVAHQLLNKTITLCRRWGARSTELRALLALCSLPDRHERTLDLLKRCRSRFTEGFETRDLVEADRLLAATRRIRHAG